MDTFESLVVCRCETCAEVALPHYTSSLDASAAVRSIGTANPGFVPDALLDSYPGDTTTAVLELCLANRWLRCEGGYQIIHSPLVDMVVAVRDRVARDIALCQHAGSHSPRHDDPDCCGVCGMWIGDDLAKRLSA
ncbi:hypothetical protein [Mycobacterium sp. URHB0021]